MISSWLKAFLLTQVCEMPFAWLMLCGRQWSTPRILAVAALASCITHPILWFIVAPLFKDYSVFVSVGEIGVVLVESVVLALGLTKLAYHEALIVSASMNAFSYLVGVMLSHFFGIL